MKTHELNTWPTYWDAVARGEKLFEVRRNDRFFQAGDVVELIRLTLDKATASYDLDYGDDGRGFGEQKKLRFRIGPILQGGQFGIEPGFCVFSLMPVNDPATVTSENGTRSESDAS